MQEILNFKFLIPMLRSGQVSKNKVSLLILFLLVSFGLGVFVVPVGAVECAGNQQCLDLQTQINDLSKEISVRAEANEKNAAQMRQLQAQVKSLQAQVKQSENELVILGKEIEEREEVIREQFGILSVKTRQFYKSLRGKSILAIIFDEAAGDKNRGLAYQSNARDQDRQIILTISGEMVEIGKQKQELEERKKYLADLSGQLGKQAEFLEGEVAGVNTYLSSLEGKIAALSAKQKAILSARSGSFITGVGSVPIGSDYDASIAGFNENAPGGSFAVFSFGAYTHRKGMSQYGAKARAASQGYEDNLQAYYCKKPVDKDTSGEIVVDGVAMNFEERYLMGIAEMPSDWPENALKAQAVAARTYAYRYKQEGKSICTTEACQVFLSSKADNTPDAWRRAVQDTRGKVLEDVVTYYSSTTGGYLSTSGWDTTDNGGGGDWTSRAYESIAGSPWFYKAWYRSGYRNSDNSCDRKPWMSEEEMADIINAWLVLKRGEGNGVDTGRVLPVTIGSCPIGGQGGDPYSMADLRSKLSNPVTSIVGKPTVTHDGSGNTTNVRFVTNRETFDISGAEFKEVFNTRAPGYISIPQKGFAFFNIERK